MRSKIKTQANAIIHFIQHLDTEMINEFLEDNRTYQDLEKYMFIHKLRLAFEKFISAGDTFLNCYQGFCNSEICNYKCAGYSFIGNHSNNYMDLILKIENGVVQDVYECIDFKNQKIGIKKNLQIKIDRVDVGGK